jgi:hypothetical protein
MKIFTGITKGSRVVLKGGTTKAIEDLNTDDIITVFNINKDTKEIEYTSSDIHQIKKNKTNNLVKYEILHAHSYGDSTIELLISQSYPIFNENLELLSYDIFGTNESWKLNTEIYQINSDTKLRTFSQPHQPAIIETITKLKTHSPIEIYSFSIENGDGFICNELFLKGKIETKVM